MATDWARYMVENPDVYEMYSDGGKWSWDQGRQQNAYMRMDGSPLQQDAVRGMDLPLETLACGHRRHVCAIVSARLRSLHE